MTKSMKTLVLTAAISGLLGGASATTTHTSQTISPEERGRANVKLARRHSPITTSTVVKVRTAVKARAAVRAATTAARARTPAKARAAVPLT